MPKRIGIDGREFLKSEKTGIGRFLYNFLSSVLEFDDRNIYILYGNQYTDVPFESPKLFIRIKNERFTTYWDHITLSKALLKDRVDVFFSPYDKCPLFSRIPSIIAVHDLIFNYFPEKNHSYIKRSLYTLSRKLMAKKSALIITGSEHSKKDIIKIWNIPDKKIEVIPYGISKLFKPVEEEKAEKIREKYRIKKNYLLYVGNFKPHKNVVTILKIFKLLPKDIKDSYEVVLCGKKDHNCKEIESEAKRLNIEGKIIFTDHVPDYELPTLYSGAKVFVFPSLYEGFGLPPLEAMACGTPVITSNTTSLPEVVGNAGIMIDPFDLNGFREAISLLISDHSLYEEYVKRGLERVKLFNQIEMSRRLLTAIEEIG